jgi:hypothetical protein
MKGSRAIQTDGLTGALALYLGLFLSVFFVFAAGLYWLLQPTVNHNPGLSAYKAPPATVLASVPAWPPGQAIVAAADAPAAKPEPAQPVAQANTGEPPAAEAKAMEPAAPAAEVKKTARKIAKRPRRSRDPMADYAARYDNGFRPWSQAAQRPGGLRPWF